ncbi:MAG: hypothetical protein LUE26_07010 [Alistipes sp.]|nr:hypothetical protein [Alistipes sp.]
MKIITIIGIAILSFSCLNTPPKNLLSSDVIDSLDLKQYPNMDYRTFEMEVKPLLQKYLIYDEKEIQRRKSKGYVLSGDLAFLIEHANQYPHDFGFFENPIIQQRLKNLTTQYFELFDVCAVESPIEPLGDDVLIIHGCMPHNCNTVFYDIFVSFYDDVISIVMANEGKLHCFSEDGKVGVEFYIWIYNYMESFGYQRRLAKEREITPFILYK